MRTLLLSDTLALALFRVRPEGMWDIDWADQRNKNLLSPEYGLLYLASYMKKREIPFDVVNVIADPEEVDTAFFRDLSNKALESEEYAQRCDEWADKRWEEVLCRIEEAPPDIILIPMAYYFMIKYVRNLVQEVRDRAPGAFIVTGGNYATLHAQEVMEEGVVDYIVVGEGEHTIVELITALDAGTPVRDVDGIVCKDEEGTITRTGARARENNLDEFPHLYTCHEEFKIKKRHEILCDLIPYGDYWPGTGMITARGCPEKCSFCLDPAIWNRKVRFHSAEYVADTVKFCQENFSSDHNRFFFGDSTFTLRWKRMEPMIELLGELGMSYTCQTRADALDARRLEKMSEAGWVTIGIGTESLDNETLNDVALKREDAGEIIDAALLCREWGIQPVMTLIAGFPGDTRAKLVRTADKLRSAGLHVSSFFPLTVFRGLGLFEGFGNVEGYAESAFWERREEARLNEWSEEWLRLSEEFPTPEELMEFTAYLNHRVRLPIQERVSA